MTDPGRYINDWTTISAIPATDLVNVFTSPDGLVTTSPCPALLVQECHTFYDRVTDKTIDLTAPYELRVVAGGFDDGEVIPAEDVSAHYVETVHRSDIRARGAES